MAATARSALRLLDRDRRVAATTRCGSGKARAAFDRGPYVGRWPIASARSCSRAFVKVAAHNARPPEVLQREAGDEVELETSGARERGAKLTLGVFERTDL
ncbi:MAG: hypothetical protein H6722_24390 [Sandaracinus sp.]|nr:hypothetical protein [Sandaracinus sp.]